MCDEAEALDSMTDDSAASLIARTQKMGLNLKQNCDEQSSIDHSTAETEDAEANEAEPSANELEVALAEWPAFVNHMEQKFGQEAFRLGYELVVRLQGDIEERPNVDIQQAFEEGLSGLIADQSQLKLFMRLCLQRIITAKVAHGAFMPNFSPQYPNALAGHQEEVQDL